MASIFAHGAVALTLGYAAKGKKKNSLNWLIMWGVLCSIIPDIDVIGFNYGVSYESMYGHRGFTHSAFFALLMGLLALFLFRKTSINPVLVIIYIFLCTLSHGLLDAMTTGGRGVAFLAPFSDERFFMPWRFIRVSPLGIRNFFSEWGLSVLISEGAFILAPCLIVILIIFILRSVFAH